MERERIKVLGIAPYDGMKSQMLKMADGRDDIDLTVFVGDLYDGVDIAQRNIHNDFDVIISRGGTAELIGNITKIPVIEITLSVYDILRAIKLAESYSGTYAIVGFPNITSSAHLLCDLMQYKINIITIHNTDEVKTILQDLKSKGYRMILCDMITNTIAKQLGLNAILMTSGNESIATAFNQAVKLCSDYANIREENRFLHDIIQGQSNETVVFDSESNLLFSTIEQDHNHIIEMLRNELPEVLTVKTYKSIKNIDGTLYSITGKQVPFHTKDHVAFYVSSNKVPISSSKYGINYSNKKEAADHFLNSFYNITGIIEEMLVKIEQMNKTNFPILIIGEAGTEREQIAGFLYSESTFQNNPLITIDCSLINDKGWEFLTNHHNSPFSDNGNTIYLHSIEFLTEIQQKQLLSTIDNMNLCKRNRLIFSCTIKPGVSLPAIGVEFSNLLSCLTINLPPLRAQSDNIPFFSSLYLNYLNVNLAKEIIGFEPEAIDLLKQYHWPNNFIQFKRILNELAVITDSSYISTVNVANALSKEEEFSENSSSESDSSIPLDPNRTLYEMNQEIIHKVLMKSENNHSIAAKKLGISRTTLWRLLKP